MIKLLLKVPYIDQKVLDTISAKLTASFGGNFGEIVIGGAAINKEVETFLHSIHFRYTVGYGMTECGPLVSYAQWDEFKPGSVGKQGGRNIGEGYERDARLLQESGGYESRYDA